MSVLDEPLRQGLGGDTVHDCAKGHSKTKVGHEKKGKLKGKALTISHISLWNILPKEMAGTLTPLQQDVRTHPRGLT